MGKRTLGAGPAWLQAHVGHTGDACLIWPFGRFGTGYAAVADGGRSVPAHRVMCRLAHGEPPTPKAHAAHTCGRGHAGCINPRHLRWATPAENQRDRIEHGTHVRGERSPNAKITAADVLSIRADRRAHTLIAADYGVTPTTIGRIKARTAWAWLPEEAA